MEVLYGALLLALVAAFVLWPILRGEKQEGAAEDPVLADLEARKEAKYREIRDAQLDHAAGKLSDEDFRGQDAQLRTEAVEILKRLDDARERTPAKAPTQPDDESPEG
jgi:hypothetical protein